VYNDLFHEFPELRKGKGLSSERESERKEEEEEEEFRASARKEEELTFNDQHRERKLFPQDRNWLPSSSRCHPLLKIVSRSACFLL